MLFFVSAYVAVVVAMVTAFVILFVALPQRFDPDWLERRWGQYAHVGGFLFRGLRTIEYSTLVASSWATRRVLGEGGVAYGFGDRAGRWLRVLARVYVLSIPVLFLASLLWYGLTWTGALQVP